MHRLYFKIRLIYLLKNILALKYLYENVSLKNSRFLGFRGFTFSENIMLNYKTLLTCILVTNYSMPVCFL